MPLFLSNVGNMLQSQARAAMNAHLRKASGGRDSQKFREDIARKCGVSPRTIGSMMSETGPGNFRLENIEAVARALKLTPAEFLTNPGLKAHEPKADYGAGNIAVLEHKRDEATEEIIGLLENTDAVGRKMALAAVKVALAGHKPIHKPQSSSN